MTGQLLRVVTASSQREPVRAGEHWPLQRVLPVFTFGALIGIWWFLVELFRPAPYLVPHPTRVLAEGVGNWDELSSNMGSTIQIALVGLAASVGLSVVLAFAAWRWGVVRRVMMPPLIMSQSIPKIALAPLLVVWFGYGALPKLVIVILVTIYPLTVGLLVGLNGVSTNVLNLCRSMGMTLPAQLWKIFLPASAPHFASAFKVSASLALIGAIIAEYVGSENGIGTVLLQAIGTQNTSLTIAAILLCAVSGTAIYLLAALLTRLSAIGLGQNYMEANQ